MESREKETGAAGWRLSNEIVSHCPLDIMINGQCESDLRWTSNVSSGMVKHASLEAGRPPMSGSLDCNHGNHD